jgi:hypothetical protein
MEIEFDTKNLKETFLDNVGGIFVILLVVLFAIGFLGKTFTPRDNTMLNWNEWQVLKVDKKYNYELSSLQQQIEALSKLVDAQPDPVRAQIVSDQIITNSNKGLSALELQRTALAAAARAVRQWAIGADTRENAQGALQNAINLVAEAEKTIVTQENGGGEKWR